MNCQECILACLGVHGECLHKQWAIMQKQKREPKVVMTKAEVEPKRIENHVLHDNENMESSLCEGKH